MQPPGAARGGSQLIVEDNAAIRFRGDADGRSIGGARRIRRPLHPARPSPFPYTVPPVAGSTSLRASDATSFPSSSADPVQTLLGRCPSAENVTEYDPGGTSEKPYIPFSSVEDALATVLAAPVARSQEKSATQTSGKANSLSSRAPSSFESTKTMLLITTSTATIGHFVGDEVTTATANLKRLRKL